MKITKLTNITGQKDGYTNYTTTETELEFMSYRNSEGNLQIMEKGQYRINNGNEIVIAIDNNASIMITLEPEDYLTGMKKLVGQYEHLRRESINHKKRQFVKHKSENLKTAADELHAEIVGRAITVYNSISRDIKDMGTPLTISDDSRLKSLNKEKEDLRRILDLKNEDIN